MYKFFFILLLSYLIFFTSSCSTNTEQATVTEQTTKQAVVKPVANNVQEGNTVKTAVQKDQPKEQKKKAPNKKMDHSKLNPLLKTPAHKLATQMATRTCLCHRTTSGSTEVYDACLKKAETDNKVEEAMAKFSKQEKELYNKVFNGITSKCIVEKK